MKPPKLCRTSASLLVLVAALAPAMSGARAAPPAPPADVEVRSFPAERRSTDQAKDDRPRVSVADLLKVESRVGELLPKLLEVTVGIARESGGQGSGVIVSADGLVLTAGHVSGTPGQRFWIYLSDGRRVSARSLGRNKTDDSGMMKIEDEGPFPFVEVGKSSSLNRGDWLIALGHPGGWRRDRPAVLRVGRMNYSKMWVTTDAVLVGGDSGGPLFDLDGRLVGIHSRIGNSTSANMHVPIDKVTGVWDRLAAGEEWNALGDGIVRALGPKPWLGIAVESTDGDDGLPPGLRVTMVEQAGPAAEAGLMAGDVITRFNSRPVEDLDELTDLITRARVGDTARLEIVRDGGEPAMLRVKLGRRPEASGR